MAFSIATSCGNTSSLLVMLPLCRHLHRHHVFDRLPRLLRKGAENAVIIEYSPAPALPLFVLTSRCLLLSVLILMNTFQDNEPLPCARGHQMCAWLRRSFCSACLCCVLICLGSTSAMANLRGKPLPSQSRSRR
jgi:hypothetical protein